MAQHLPSPKFSLPGEQQVDLAQGELFPGIIHILVSTAMDSENHPHPAQQHSGTQWTARPQGQWWAEQPLAPLPQVWDGGEFLCGRWRKGIATEQAEPHCWSALKFSSASLHQDLFTSHPLHLSLCFHRLLTTRRLQVLAFKPPHWMLWDSEQDYVTSHQHTKYHLSHREQQ